MNDIKASIAYAKIMETLRILKDWCKKHSYCSGCPITDKYGSCLLCRCPEKYDLDKLGKVVVEYIINTPDE